MALSLYTFTSHLISIRKEFPFFVYCIFFTPASLQTLFIFFILVACIRSFAVVFCYHFSWKSKLFFAYFSVAACVYSYFCCRLFWVHLKIKSCVSLRKLRNRTFLRLFGYSKVSTQINMCMLLLFFWSSLTLLCAEFPLFYNFFKFHCHYISSNAGLFKRLLNSPWK